MTRLLLLILLFFLAYTVFTAAVRLLSKKPASPPPEKTPKGEDMVKDPSCGIFLPRGDALEKYVGGKHYYFCSEECLNKFQGEDDKQ
jgi:uncharacterized protein